MPGAACDEPSEAAVVPGFAGPLGEQSRCAALELTSAGPLAPACEVGERCCDAGAALGA